MKLNADIIYNALKEAYSVSIEGERAKELCLSRPEFYMEDERSFQSRHLYLATAEHLPHRPDIRNGAVLVCIGENIHLRYYRERLCLITIRSKADFFRVFQFIQAVFDRYDTWEDALVKNLLEEADIRRMVDDSLDIFRKPLTVLDRSFRYVASAGTEGSTEWMPSSGGFLTSENLSAFMSESDLMTEKKGALRIEMHGNRILSVNLFSREDEYEGCLNVAVGENGFDDGEEALAVFLAGMLEKLIARSPGILNDEASSLKSLLYALVQEQPISYAQRMMLNASNRKNTYVCVYMQYREKHNHIPAGYICDMFEETFSDSYAVRISDNLVCFLNINKGFEASEKKLNEFVQSLNLSAGVSGCFSDLFDIRVHFSQAVAACENGLLLDPSQHVFMFRDYALTEMIINSLGSLPAEAYFPDGLAGLIEHDRQSGVSYLETLRVFLEENMSYTSASRRLYIHRSTLIDRIARIERDLDINLSDSDQRLRMEMILKAVELEGKIHPAN